MRKRWTQRLAAMLVVLVAVLAWAPGVLAFPYRAQVGEVTVHAVQPIDPRIAGEVARADALVRAAGLPAPPRDVYLTGGGWRWRLLSLGAGGAFGLRRPFVSAIIVNRADLSADRVTNGAAIGATRTFSGVLAHETTHLVVARRIGEGRAWLLPRWKSEGLADCVARESSLSDADAARLRAAGEHPPALFYHDARARVAATLKADGGSVDRLLAE